MGPDWRSGFDLCPDGILFLDDKGTIVNCNAAALELFGYHREILLGKDFVTTLLSPDFRQTKLSFSPPNPSPSWTDSSRVCALKKNGGTFLIELLLVQSRDPHETVAVAFIRNGPGEPPAKDSIQENEGLKTELQTRTAQLEAITRELEAFSYSVSHDLRAPLRAIDGFSRIIEEDFSSVLDPEAQRLLKSIRANSVKMGKLLDDLLEFSRTGREALKPTTIRMMEMVTAVWGEIKTRKPEWQVELDLKPLPPVFGDPALIRKVWWHLLSNALKFSHQKDQPRVEVGFRQNGNEKFFYVSDNGIGFDPKFSSRLFGVFQKLHPPADFEGNGIGLAIVRRILARHEGKIWAEAEVQRGAIFYFNLPED